MNITGRLFAFVAATILLFCQTRSEAALTYRLEPISSITPTGGTLEPLTGTFVWQGFDTGSSIVGFDATDLHFESASILLTLNRTPANNLASSLIPTTGGSFFEEVVDAVGLPFSTVRFSASALGSFEGPIDAPTRLIYPDYRLVPVGGGPFLARIGFAAQLVPPSQPVPEPANGVLALIGLGALAQVARNRLKGA